LESKYGTDYFARKVKRLRFRLLKFYNGKPSPSKRYWTGSQEFGLAKIFLDLKKDNHLFNVHPEKLFEQYPIKSNL